MQLFSLLKEFKIPILDISSSMTLLSYLGPVSTSAYSMGEKSLAFYVEVKS